MAAPVFRLNGIDVLHPGQMANEFSRLGINDSDWRDRANQFVERRGVDPSFGFLLCTSDAISLTNSQLQIFLPVDTNGQQPNPKSFNVKIEWHKKIGQATEQKGFHLVKIVDDRYGLSASYVGKRFNHVIDYIPAPPNTSSNGDFVYHPDTLKVHSSTLTTPYTWEQLFDECFKLPGSPTLSKQGITFPSYTPQDLDWRYVTRRDALEMLLQWTNLTIVWEHSSGQWKLVEIKGQPQLAQFENLLCKSNYIKYGKPGEVIPEKLRVHFAKVDKSQSDVEEYQVVELAGGFSQNGHTLDIRLPAHYTNTFDTPVLVQPTAQAFFDKANDRWEQFPPQEKTYQGFLPINVSGAVEQVIYYHFSKTAYTAVQSVLKRDWIIRPKTLEAEGVSHVFGRVLGNVTPLDAIFQVIPERTIYGRYPKGATVLPTVNSHAQSFNDGDTIDIFQRMDDQFWFPTRVGGGGGGGAKETVRFELSQDKLTSDFVVNAYQLDGDGNRMLTIDPDDPDNQILKIIKVGDPWLRHHGYTEYTDPFYGYQAGYRGTAVFVSNLGDFNGASLFEIIDIEHVARYIELEQPSPTNEFQTPSDFDYIGGIGYALPTLNYWDGRPPKTLPHTIGSSQPYTFDAIQYTDSQNLFGKIKAGDSFKCIWDEKETIYKVFAAKQKAQGGGGQFAQGILEKDLTIETLLTTMFVEASSDATLIGSVLSVANPVDNLAFQPPNRPVPRLFMGNAGGFCIAQLDATTGIWNLVIVQSPTQVPINPDNIA